MQFTSISIAIIFALASLGLFIFSTKKLSNSLKILGDSKFKQILLYISKNNFISLLIGTLLTTLIQSSDGAVALIMSLLAARFINLRSAIAFLLGANIGTATTSLIVSFQANFAFTEYFILLIFVGVFGTLIFKKTSLINLFTILISIGMIFFSLKIMSSAAKEIVKSEFFVNAVKFVGINPWSSFLFSFILTGILQSSSASITLYQIMYTSSQNLLNLNSAIGLIFGANVGTTLTGLIIAYSSKNINSKKIAIVWGITNLSISILLLFFLSPLGYYADFINLIISPKNKSLQLSIAHLFFNLILVSIFIWLIKPLENLVNKITRDKFNRREYEIILPHELINQNTYLAIKASQKAIQIQSKIALKGFNLLNAYIQNIDKNKIDEFDNLAHIVDTSRHEIYKYLIKINTKKMSKYDSKLHLSLVLSSQSIAKIMHLGTKIIAELKFLIKTHKHSKTNLVQLILHEIKDLINIIQSLIENVSKQLQNYSQQQSSLISKLKENVDSLSFEFLNLYIDKLKNNTVINYDFDYSRLLRSIERIAHHCLRIDKYMQNTI
ncbi:Na/Pi cotransporter family protein [Mycoplasmopsis phocirhinis]|uniref:Na/Pi cotransporter family protein n=1 Tax=Mycoplasmopsis phocirhinis TaxID=142650 RepID=A0A4V0ZAG8_9BACT|nr:Na/Pi symporter [Mycoplasmopsis phocirhinis]QBF34652.1 Na/Pi cotransporter family protein [Mycoplasmopsis phocirhinis]